MSTADFIIGLFYRVDLTIGHLPKHPQAGLYPSELVTLALLFALKGGSTRAFYRWLQRDYAAWFPGLPERSRLFRAFAAHQDWTEYFLADPTTLGVIDSYGIELVHPWREHRSDGQLGTKGLSNHRWIIGAKLVYLVNQLGQIVAWDYAAAHVADNAFHGLISEFADEMLILGDTGFHATAGDPPNLKVCKRGTWNVRMVVEQVLSLLTTVCHMKKGRHRTWRGVQTRLAFTMALFNILIAWDGLQVERDGTIHLSMAQFSL